MSDLKFTPADPSELADLLAGARVVGLGTSTRAGAQTFDFVERTTRQLLDNGFRTVAVRDNQRVGELYDAFVTGHLQSLQEVLPQAWGPWRTVEMHDALVWLREYNAGRADPVRVIGVGSSRVLVADYDRVLELTGHPPRMREIFDVIRVAHENGEHVQRARGTHPGTPFVELAREAAGLVRSPEATELMTAIVQHHANALGVGYDATRDDEETAERLLALPGKTVFWEGSAHVAAQFPLGARLRARMADDYQAVHVTFGSGTVAGVSVPLPAAGSLEHDLLAASGGEQGLVAALPEKPAKTRLISGLYDPARDEQHYYDLPSLKGSFDVVVFFPKVTSTSWFGTAKP